MPSGRHPLGRSMMDGNTSLAAAGAPTAMAAGAATAAASSVRRFMAPDVSRNFGEYSPVSLIGTNFAGMLPGLVPAFVPRLLLAAVGPARRCSFPTTVGLCRLDFRFTGRAHPSRRLEHRHLVHVDLRPVAL